MTHEPTDAEKVWYVAYASNLGVGRFRCYLAGGRPEGGLRTYPGCRDGADPAAWFSFEHPGGLVFAGTSGVWGGGMAFFDPDRPGTVACRAYLVTVEQFGDVVAQEMRHPPGGDFARALAAVVPEVGELHTLGPGRYETVLRLGAREGVSMLTVTSSDVDAIEHNPPSAAYLRSIATGLRESHGWDDARIVDYLVAAAGLDGVWTPAGVATAIGTGAAS
jgi:hypothetical protein